MCNVSLRSVAGGISSGGFRSQREPPFFSSLATSLESLDLPHAPTRPPSGSDLISLLRPPMRDSSWTRRRGRPGYGNRSSRYAEQDLVSDVARRWERPCGRQPSQEASHADPLALACAFEVGRFDCCGLSNLDPGTNGFVRRLRSASSYPGPLRGRNL